MLGVGEAGPHSLKAAALCSAAAMATPYVHGHDLCVLAIAAVFLVKDGLERGFLPGDRLIMLWTVIFLGFRDFSSGWIPCLALLALVVRRIPDRSRIEFPRSCRISSLLPARADRSSRHII